MSSVAAVAEEFFALRVGQLHDAVRVHDHQAVWRELEDAAEELLRLAEALTLVGQFVLLREQLLLLRKQFLPRPRQFPVCAASRRACS